VYGYSIELLQTATTRRKAVSTRRILALLVVLALSLGLCSIPAGSATLQRNAATGEQVVGVATYKGGDDGEGIESGDDDRWGNNPIDDDPPESGGEPGDDEEANGEISGRVMGRVHVISVRFLFGYLVALL
jgi:hypothetical protein